jgi:hypothetical protein
MSRDVCRLVAAGFRVLQGALLASLRANYDLAGELHAPDERHGNISED